MGECLKGAFFGMAVGFCVGAIVVAKNKKLASKIKSGVDCAETKIEEAKEKIEEKISESQNESEKPIQSCECESAGFESKNKKSKNY